MWCSCRKLWVVLSRLGRAEPSLLVPTLAASLPGGTRGSQELIDAAKIPESWSWVVRG